MARPAVARASGTGKWHTPTRVLLRPAHRCGARAHKAQKTPLFTPQKNCCDVLFRFLLGCFAARPLGITSSWSRIVMASNHCAHVPGQRPAAATRAPALLLSQNKHPCSMFFSSRHVLGNFCGPQRARNLIPTSLLMFFKVGSASLSRATPSPTSYTRKTARTIPTATSAKAAQWRIHGNGALSLT